MLYRCIVYIGTLLFHVRVVNNNYIREFDDSIVFRLNWPGPFDTLSEEIQSSTKETNKDAHDSNFLHITSVDKEKYHCLLPSTLSSEKEAGEKSYTGPSPLQLLKPLFTQVTCSYRLEQYWTYELCHGRFLRQYHEESTIQGRASQEYILGKFDSAKYEMAEVEYNKQMERWKSEDKKKLPTTKIEGLELPYIQINMTDGTFCDLNKQARTTYIQYVCYKEGKHEMYSLKETSTCEYEVVILSPYLCSHPQFRVKTAPENNIYCHSMDGSPNKPEHLLLLEQDAENFQHGGKDLYSWPSDLSSQTSATSTSPPASATATVESHVSEEQSTPYDIKLIQDFLNGDYCLQGGTGWWKYEFCYGKKVEQYHEEKGGEKTTIVLGRWNHQQHLDWITKYPQKKQVPRQVSHLYTAGNYCEETGKYRQVEVKLRCKEVKGHPNAVSIYLLEPKICEYILGVESPIICPLLETADQDGLLHTDLLTS